LNQSLPEYNPPSFAPLQARDYQTFVSAVVDFLQNRQAQYQIQFLQQVINVLNTGTQAFGADLTATIFVAPYGAGWLIPTNWAHRVVSTEPVNTIAVPKGYQSFVRFLALNGFSFTAGGNISNPTAIAAGHVADATYDPIGGLWWIITS